MEVISKYGKLGCFLGSSDYNHAYMGVNVIDAMGLWVET